MEANPFSLYMTSPAPSPCLHLLWCEGEEVALRWWWQQRTNILHYWVTWCTISAALIYSRKPSSSTRSCMCICILFSAHPLEERFGVPKSEVKILVVNFGLDSGKNWAFIDAIWFCVVWCVSFSDWVELFAQTVGNWTTLLCNWWLDCKECTCLTRVYFYLSLVVSRDILLMFNLVLLVHMETMRIKGLNILFWLSSNVHIGALGEWFDLVWCCWGELRSICVGGWYILNQTNVVICFLLVVSRWKRDYIYGIEMVAFLS